MKDYIKKLVKEFFKSLIKDLLLDIIQNRIATLRRIRLDNEGNYDDIDDTLMKAKIQALEEAHTILVSALDE